MPEIVTRQVDGITVLDIPHSLLNLPKDSKDRGTLHRVITESLDGGHNKIVLNLSQVTGYCTSTGLSELIWGLKTIRARSGQLKLSNVPPSVRTGLELSRVLKLFDLYDDEASAIQSFQSAPSETVSQLAMREPDKIAGLNGPKPDVPKPNVPKSIDDEASAIHSFQSAPSETISQLAMREVSGITVLDIPKSIMEISRTSEECGKLLKLVQESLGRGRKNIVLNLSQVGYSSHTALGELVAAFTTIRNQGGHLKLSNVPPNFRASLEITHLLPIFEIYDDEAAAIHSFQSTV
jgi:anti-sigma B factor antagonist